MRLIHKIGASTPARRVADVEDIVGPAIFLASDEAAFIHDKVMLVDGGWIAEGHVKEMT